MNIWDFLFSSTNVPQPQPGIRFGRYTDAYKVTAQYDAWNVAIEEFDKENYIAAYRAFFDYLRDEQEDNVHYWEENGGLRFEIWQGSRTVNGFVDNRQIRAEAKIAKANALNLGYMRRLMELNYGLIYSHYALDDENQLTVMFHSATTDGSPHKLYYALREVATQADKQDDLLLDEFDVLEMLYSGSRKELSVNEADIKIQYLKDAITRSKDIVANSNIDKEEYPGAIAYLYLHLIYRLDYLIKPEGFMMETLERAHREYFTQDTKTTEQKTAAIEKELDKILTRTPTQMKTELYQVVSTFGITKTEGHERLTAMIDAELPKMDWYVQQGYIDFGLAIPGYIVGFSQFNFALPKPDRQLLHLYFMICEATYFKSLGFSTDYFDDVKKQFNTKAIKAAIKEIIANNIAKYPKMKPNLDSLQFDTMPSFAKSYLLMVRNLEM